MGWMCGAGGGEAARSLYACLSVARVGPHAAVHALAQRGGYPRARSRRRPWVLGCATRTRARVALSARVAIIRVRAYGAA